MPSIDQHTSPHGHRSTRRWVTIGAVVAVLAVAVVLLVLYGGGGSGGGY